MSEISPFIINPQVKHDSLVVQSDRLDTLWHNQELSDAEYFGQSAVTGLRMAGVRLARAGNLTGVGSRLDDLIASGELDRQLVSPDDIRAQDRKLKNRIFSNRNCVELVLSDETRSDVENLELSASRHSSYRFRDLLAAGVIDDEESKRLFSTIRVIHSLRSGMSQRIDELKDYDPVFGRLYKSDPRLLVDNTLLGRQTDIGIIPGFTGAISLHRRESVLATARANELFGERGGEAVRLVGAITLLRTSQINRKYGSIADVRVPLAQSIVERDLDRTRELFVNLALNNPEMLTDAIAAELGLPDLQEWIGEIASIRKSEKRISTARANEITAERKTMQELSDTFDTSVADEASGKQFFETFIEPGIYEYVDSPAKYDPKTFEIIREEVKRRVEVIDFLHTNKVNGNAAASRGCYVRTHNVGAKPTQLGEKRINVRAMKSVFSDIYGGTWRKVS